VLTAAAATILSVVLVGLGTTAPALAGSGTLQNGPFAAGNLLSYANSDFEGHANFVPVTNIGSISDTTAAALHGIDSLEFESEAGGTTALKLQVGSSPTQINVTGGATYTLGGWFKLPSANSGESVSFGMYLYDSAGTWINWYSTGPLTLSAVSGWQYVEGQITVPSNAAWALDSPEVILNNAAQGQLTYMDMLVFKPYRAAQAIGAKGPLCVNGKCGDYTASDWGYANSTIGPLQSDKEFFNSTNNPPDGDLPSSFHNTACYGIEQSLGSTNYSAWPVCILAYTGTSMTFTDMDNFLSTVPPQQELYLVWRQEPELDSFSNGVPACPGLTGGKAFVCEFQYQANLIHGSAYFGPNIFVAMDSAGSQYGDLVDDLSANDDTGVGTNGTNGCAYIPPSNADPNGGADIYLLDFYQNSQVDGTNVNTEAIREDNWKNWLNCVTPRNRPIGFGEYGLDQSTGGTTEPCDNNPNGNDAAQTPSAMAADNGYLKQLPMSSQSEMQNHVPVVVWNYWYDDDDSSPVCTQFDNSYGAITEWQSIETANGGG
jgi:hypothetical protein